METTTRRPNQDTPERWQTALRRASAQGVTVRQIQCGAWVATSGTDSEAAYLVTSHGCECAAGVALDPVCKHRAALREMLGTLALETPEAPAVEVEAEMTPAEWAAFWDSLFAQYPAIAPGPVTSMSAFAIVADPRSLPVDGLCPACDGRGDFRKESSTFKGTTYRVGCRSCKGSGFAPVEPRRRIAA